MNLVLCGVGISILLIKRNILFIIIGIELILQAAISNFVAFNTHYPNFILEGQVIAIFATAIVGCEIVVFIALTLSIYKIRNSNKLGLSIDTK